MSDIFVSYSSDDRDRVLPLVNALEETGWSVFWDRTIPAGKTWRQVIGSEIQTCRTVIVVWTDKSITSEWVHEEAEAGKRKRILIPVMLDNVEPPFGFSSIQAANLSGWNGESSSPMFSRLVTDITAILGHAPMLKRHQESHSLVAETQRKSEQERIHQQEQQLPEKQTQQNHQVDNKGHITIDDDRALQEAGLRRLEEQPGACERNEYSHQIQNAPESFARPNRSQIYAGGVIVALIFVAVIVAFMSPGEYTAPPPTVPAEDWPSQSKTPMTGNPEGLTLPSPSLNLTRGKATSSGKIIEAEIQKPVVVSRRPAVGCNNLTFDLDTGMLNNVPPTVSQEEVKSVFPCSTGSSPDGESYNYGGGVFFGNHSFFFYTGKDFIEVRDKFRGVVSIPLLGTDQSTIQQELGQPQRELENIWLFGRSYGCLRVEFAHDKVFRIGSHYERCDKVENLYQDEHQIIPDALRHIKAG